MSIILIDSMDHYDTAHAYTKWSGTPQIVSGRTGNGVLGSLNAKKIFDLGAVFTVGAAWYPPSALTSNIFVFDISSGARAVLSLLSDGRLKMAYSYNWNTLSWTDLICDTPIIPIPNWYYIELYIRHFNNPGDPGISGIDFICRVNEELIFAATMIQYHDAVETGFTSCTFGGGLSGTFDDIYLMDTQEFLGDIRIFVIRPNGDSTPSSWVPSTAGAPHYQMVDDTNPDDDTTYLQSTSVGDQDMVELEDITLVGEIKGLQANYVIKKDEAGSAAFKAEFVTNSASYEDPTDRFLSYLSYRDFIIPFRTNPVTGVDWTNDEINALIMGLKRSA